MLAIPTCFNTQPPEGGWQVLLPMQGICFCFNTQPPEGGWRFNVSDTSQVYSFNTQPPEGGWKPLNPQYPMLSWFQHTAARRRLVSASYCSLISVLFQHTAARRRLEPLSKALLHQVSQPRVR